jgi:hypothetical protein
LPALALWGIPESSLGLGVPSRADPLSCSLGSTHHLARARSRPRSKFPNLPNLSSFFFSLPHPLLLIIQSDGLLQRLRCPVGIKTWESCSPIYLATPQVADILDQSPTPSVHTDLSSSSLPLFLPLPRLLISLDPTRPLLPSSHSTSSLIHPSLTSLPAPSFQWPSTK